MTHISKHELTCGNCHNNFKAKLYDSINVTLDPQLINEIYEGRFNVVTCPKCKTQGYVPGWFLFHDIEKKIMREVSGDQMLAFIQYLYVGGYFKNVRKSKENMSVYNV